MKNARLYMVRTYLDINEIPYDEDQLEDEEFLGSFVRIYGDDLTRLNSVYNPQESSQVPADWWRIIQ
ncbi:MAG: hypothetical protein D8M22_07725 [Armatimonadetes bacterium]|nr:hypothetical protein [Armatimonadota bacterium]